MREKAAVEVEWAMLSLMLVGKSLFWGQEQSILQVTDLTISKTTGHPLFWGREQSMAEAARGAWAAEKRMEGRRKQHSRS